MRKILFRGKRKDNGEWVKGSFWDEVPGELVGIAQYGSCVFHHVDLATVGQFTGLTDKNGNRIFEGDIVESVFTKKPYLVCFGEYTFVDEYENDSWACGWYNEEKGGYITAFGCPEDWATVIGNIHDNPELLNGGNENE